MIITGANYARYAQTFEGVPWKHQGRTRHGLDCVGLIIVAARDLGLLDDNFDVRGYTPRPQSHTFLEYFRHFCTPVQWSDMRLGDILLFRNKRFPVHCGIVTQVGHDIRFIHSENNATETGTVHEQPLFSEWKECCTHVYRFKRLVG